MGDGTVAHPAHRDTRGARPVAPTRLADLACRPGFGSWLVAIVWNVYGPTDVVFANAIDAFAPDAQPLAPAFRLIPPFFASGAHLVNLRLLTGKVSRDYYLGSTGPDGAPLTAG